MHLNMVQVQQVDRYRCRDTGTDVDGMLSDELAVKPKVQPLTLVLTDYTWFEPYKPVLMYFSTIK